MKLGLIFDEKDEIMFALRGEELPSPYVEMQR